MGNQITYQDVLKHVKKKKEFNSKKTPKDIKEAFDLFDKDKNGVIDASELGQVMQSLGCQPTEEELQKMVGSVDVNGDGTIDFDEFLLMMQNKSQENPSSVEEEMLQSFLVFDKNGDGYISREELKLVMASLGEDLSEDDLNAMMRQADTDGDGRINYQEFCNMMVG